MSSVTAFASAIAASICEAVDASVAFCFVRDIETEQLLGCYAAQSPKCTPYRPSSPNKDEDTQDQRRPSPSLEPHQFSSVVSIQTSTALPAEVESLQNRFKSLKAEPGEATWVVGRMRWTRCDDGMQLIKAFLMLVAGSVSESMVRCAMPT